MGRVKAAFMELEESDMQGNYDFKVDLKTSRPMTQKEIDDRNDFNEVLLFLHDMKIRVFPAQLAIIPAILRGETIIRSRQAGRSTLINLTNQFQEWRKQHNG